LEENLDYEEKEDEFDVVSTDLQFWHFVISPHQKSNYRHIAHPDVGP
jgi:hypothetical protein